MYPVYLNPAMTGNFDGDYRFNAIYRSQWNAVTKPYSTFGFSADASNIASKKIGAGVHFLHDVTGDGRFRTIDLMFSGSYAIVFSKKNKTRSEPTRTMGEVTRKRGEVTRTPVHTLTPGIQLGLNYRQIDLAKLTFDNQFNGWNYDPTLPNGEAFQTSKKASFNLNLGLVYEWKVDQRKRLLVGYAAANITKPNQTFFGNKQVRRDVRHTVHIEGQFKVATKWDVIPRFLMNVQGKYNEIILGTEGRYIIRDERGDYMAGYMGIYYRNKDAVYLTFTFDYNNWKAGFSYDMNFSKLVPASRVRGGFEISLQYILKTFKPKKVLHRVCPDYI